MNLFELFVKIGVDDQASGKLGELSGKLGNGLKTAAKIGTAAVGAAAAGIGALTKAAVDNYAEYEQLVGGVETLFKENSGLIQELASNAYKTAGISANSYMEQATAFSASLIQALGGDTAAASAYANRAILDMSDNANKMGTDIETIQMTYQSLMRGNYAMLDNLKLGYGGTKAELERLVSDAEKLTGEALDPSKFSDVITAINAVQTELGITGTTVKEAGTTIEGSVNSMKAAWDNLITGIADDSADLDMLIGNFVESVGAVATNLIPKIGTALNGASKLVRDLIPVIVQEIPVLIEENLTILAEAGVAIIQSLVDGISQNQEMLFETVFGVITYLTESFITMLPQIVQLGLDLIVSLANGIAENIPELIPTIVDVVIQIVETLIDNVDMLVDAAIAIIIGLTEGIINALPRLIEKAPEIIEKLVTAIVNNVPKLLKAALEIIVMLANGLISNIPKLIEAIPKIVTSIVKGFTSHMSQIKGIGKNIVNGVWQGIQSMVSWFTNKVKSFFSGIVNSVKNALGIHSPSKVFASIGCYMAEGLAEGWDKEYNGIKHGIEKDLNFGTATVDFASSGIARNSSVFSNSASKILANANENITIVVQSVLDGKVIGETAYQYSKNKQRAYGVT